MINCCCPSYFINGEQMHRDLKTKTIYYFGIFDVKGRAGFY